MENKSGGHEGRGARKREAQQAQVTRRAFIAGGAAAAVTVAGAGVYFLSGEHEDKRSLKEVVNSFTWEDAKKPEKLAAFTSRLADEYLKVTKSTRVKKEDLVGEGKTTIFKSTQEYREVVKKVNPNFYLSDSNFGYTHYESKEVYVDAQNLERQTKDIGNAGLAYIDVLWHEWGHVDVTSRAQGEFINNPNHYFSVPPTGRREEYKKYRGGLVYTDSYDGFSRLDEVWNEAVTIRRIIDALQIGQNEGLISGKDYYQNGIDFFPLLTSALGITTEELYQMHATSDFEGLAKRIGSRLPGQGTPFEKGKVLFIGIHTNNVDIIRQTGALNLIPQR